MSKAAPVRVSRLLAMGDIHGEYEKSVALLQSVQLIDAQLSWIGQNDRLILVGDYLDRGPHGIEVLRMVRRLQQEAAQAGGQVIALLGNHDALMIAHTRGQDGSLPDEKAYGEIESNHFANGGFQAEVLTLRESPDLLTWYAQLPMLHLEGDILFGHGNIDYTLFAPNMAEVNQFFRELHQSAHGSIMSFAALTVRSWAADDTESHHRSVRYTLNAYDGVQRMLETFGGRLYVHGHSPKNNTLQQPHLYAEKLAYNIDHALCYHPDLNGYVLELTEGQPHQHHVAEPPDILERLYIRYRSEPIPLRCVLLRDQILEIQRNRGEIFDPINAKDLEDIERALNDLHRMLEVQNDFDANEITLQMIEQMEQLREVWSTEYQAQHMT